MAPLILISPTCAACATGAAPRSSPAMVMKCQRFITFPVKIHTNKKYGHSKQFRPLGLTPKTFRHRHGLEHGLGFVDGLLKFAFGRRIADPAASGLHVSLAALEQRGADGDAGLEMAVKQKIPDAAAVRSAGGLYGGCVGYFSFNGNLDTCITI